MSKELAEAVKLFISQPLNNPLSRGQIMEVARIALPILEKQERGEGDWIEWGGGDCEKEEQPVTGMVEVNYRNGVISKCNAGLRFWGHQGIDSDIIAYRIIPERATNQNGEQ